LILIVIPRSSAAAGTNHMRTATSVNTVVMRCPAALLRLGASLEIEKFSTKTVIGIEQDFHGLVFLSTLESILIKKDEEKMGNENLEKKRKYEYKINKSVSYTALADHIVDLLLNPDVPTSEVLDKLSRLFKNGSSPQRPGRQFKRKESTSTQKLRFHKYEKRVCA